MGYGVLMGQETRLLQKNESLIVQSAYKNGLLTNAKEINTGNYKADVNKPHLVNSTSSNCPSTLSWGIREVIFYSNTEVLIQITGVDTDNNAKVWHCVGSSTNGIFTIGNWVAIEPPILKVGTSTELGLTKLYGNVGNYTDGTMTQAAITSKFKEYIPIDSIDDYLTSFQDTEPDDESSARFWVDTNDSEKIMIPEINDNETNAVDTWSSNKIDESIKNVRAEVEEFLEANASGLSIVTELGSSEVTDETVTLKQFTTGEYMIFGGSNESMVVEDINRHSVGLTEVLKTVGDTISDYVELVDNGRVLIKPGTYLISGKVQITSSSIPTSVLARWLTNSDNSDVLYSSSESQNAEAYTYVGIGTIQAKVSFTETIIKLTKNTYFELTFNACEAGEMIISPEACRLQVVKIR